MEYRRLGRTGYLVSVIGLGTVELGLDYGIADERGKSRPSKDDASRLLNLALDSGINLIDTARVYGTSEEVIGAALKSRRREYFVASKVTGMPGERNGNGALRSYVRSSVQKSLEALQTDAIDLMQLHSLSEEEIRRGEYTEILQELQRAGSIRFLGATTYGEEAALSALEDGRFDCIQVAYNLLDREPEARVLPLALSKDVGVIIRSVLLKGALTHRYRYLPADLEELKSAVDQIWNLTEAGSWKLTELAYRYVLGHPAVSTTLVGTAHCDELQAAVGYVHCEPPPPRWREQVRQITIKDSNQLNPATWSVQ